MTESDRLQNGEPDSHFVDEHGRPTDDPARAVRGEVVDVDESGRRRRFWFVTGEAKLDWLPVSESAFLLWVLVGLLGLWLLLGFALGLI